MREKKLFNIYGFTGGSYAGNVYHPEYLSPSLNTMGGGNRQPLIVEIKKEIMTLDCYNHKLHTGEVIGAVVSHSGRWGTTNGWKLIEIYEEKDY